MRAAEPAMEMECKDRWPSCRVWPPYHWLAAESAKYLASRPAKLPAQEQASPFVFSITAQPRPDQEAQPICCSCSCQPNRNPPNSIYFLSRAPSPSPRARFPRNPHRHPSPKAIDFPPSSTLIFPIPLGRRNSFPIRAGSNPTGDPET